MKKTTNNPAAKPPGLADLGMGDLRIEGEEVVQPTTPDKDDPTVEKVIASEPNNDKPVNFVPRQLPPDIYYSVSNAELERLLPYLIGDASTKRITELGKGRNVKPVAVLRQGIVSADEQGAFLPVNGKERRTGNDDRPEHPDNRRIRAVLGESCFLVVQKAAKNHKPPLSNRAALYHAVRHALEASMI